MAVATTWGYQADSDDEFEENEEKGFGGKSVLFLIVDCTPKMFETWKEDDDDVPFLAAIKCCQAVLRSKIVSAEKDLVTLLFVGSVQSKNSSNFENIYQLHELSSVKVAMIEDLNRMKSTEDYDDFKTKIGSSNDYDLKDLFWITKIIIDEGKASTYQKKIMYFTAEDSPHAGKPFLQKEAVQKFKDIGKVQLTVVAFNEKFGFQNFYSKILEDESNIIKASNLESLLKVVRVKQRLRRPISRTTLEIVPGIKIGVGFYSFVRPTKPPTQVTINKHTNQVLHRTVNEYRAESGVPVLKSEERKIANVGGEKVVFTKGEIKEVKHSESGVSLIGFLSNKEFNQFKWYRSPGYFLYPDDESITGSKDLFTTLLKRCHILKKIILVKMTLSRGRSPKLACLIPSVEEDSLFPQGFHVFPIPFSDEMRKLEFEIQSVPSAELVEMMEKVIKKITNKKFDMLDVYNPTIQYRWRDLERIALDLSEEEQDEFDDLTEPNEELMAERLETLPNEIEAEAESCSSLYGGQKSTAAVFKHQPSNFNMAMEAKNKRVEKLTIPVLKEFLESKRFSTGVKFAKKADYVAAVYNFFEKNGFD